MIFLVKIQKCEKFWQKQSNFGYFSQKLDFLKISRYRFFLQKWSWSRNLVEWYLYVVSKNLWNRFLNFWFFWKYGRLCPKCWTFCYFLQNFGHILKKNQRFKSLFHRLFRGTTRLNFSFLGSFLKKKSVPA